MQVSVSPVGLLAILRHVVVDHNVHSLDVDTSVDEIGGDHNPLLALLESLVPVQPLLLLHPSVDANRREAAVPQEFVEGNRPINALDEDHHLVEVQRVKQVVKLSVLLALLHVHVVLHQTVQGELGLVVHVDFHWVAHELLADSPDVLGQGCAEHHDLLVVRGELEDLLDVGPHVELLEHLVALVKNEVPDVVELQVAILSQSLHPSWGSDHDVWRARLQVLLLRLDADSTEDGADLDVRQVSRESLELVGDLESKLSRVAHHQSLNLALLWLELLQDRQDEYGRLSHTTLGLAQHVLSQDRLRDALVLHLRWMLETTVHNRSQQLRLEQKVLEPSRVYGHETLLPTSFLLVPRRFLRLSLLLGQLLLLLVVNKLFLFRHPSLSLSLALRYFSLSLSR
mmetsp:Transcript_3033/g.8215  ORF Transcript_3033/g.8215 Transcript_3033/m.8215 type:complete len:398 (-) Transcript_3033:169-1362(-)